MSKNTQISELINYISVDGSGHVVFTTVPSSASNTDKFLVSDSGVLKYRTAAQLLSDIGAQASGNYQTALTNPVTGTGTANYLPKFIGSTSIANSLIFDNGTNVLIGTTTKSVKYSVFVPMLIKAIQEQQEIINEMRAEIDSLKTK